MQRRAFVVEAVKAFAVAAGAWYLIGCGSSPTVPSEVASISAVSTLVNSHTHTMGVPSSDQLHPADTTYTTSTDLDHNHMVTLTANQLSTLAAGGSVTVTTTSSSVTGNHTHRFTLEGKKT